MIKLLVLAKERLITIGAIAFAVISIFTVIGMMDEYRWWVWASEFRVVANRVYEVTIPEQRRVISGIERQLDRAVAVPPQQRKFTDDKRINDLEQDLQDEKDLLDKLIEERARFSR